MTAVESHKAEGYVDTGVKILISVVIGALLLAGLYALFNTTIIPTVTSKVQGLFNYTGNTIIKLKAKLLVIDPFQAYLGDADLSNAMSMRKVLRRLSMWASQYDCAIVLVGHLNKKSSSKELYRGLGSIDVAAAARSVLQIDTDEDDDEVRILRHVKSSLAPKGKDTFFKITNNSLIEWTEKEVSTEQSWNQSSEKVQILKTDKQTEIAERIKELLSDGPQNSKEMVEQLSLLGVSKRTIMSVKGILGIQSKRIDGTWFWCLPETGSDIDGQKI